MKIGIIAPEFPPAIGGMHTLAWGLAETLGHSDDVTVYVRDDVDIKANPHFRQSPLLSGNFGSDLARLAPEDVDLWLGVNGGLVPLAPHLDQPFFVYLHGSDFLMPWISYGSHWLEPLRRPYLGKLKRALRRISIRRTIGAVEHVFVNSQRTAELASTTLGVDGKRITLCPPGVEDGFFQTARAADPLPDNRFEVVTVTRLTKHSARKNVDGVLHAIARLEDAVDIHYTVVGDGDDRQRLENLACKLGLADRVTFAGRLSNAELLACYRNADLFVLASKATRYDIEGFGIVYMEASASGVPVICSAEGGATDAVSEGTNGIIIADSSATSIATGIRHMFTQRKLFPPEQVRGFAEGYRWPDVTARLRAELVLGIGRRPSRAAA